MTTGLTADSAPSRNGSDDHSQIRAMIADFARATAAKDIERIMSHQAADVVTFH